MNQPLGPINAGKLTPPSERALMTAFLSSSNPKTLVPGSLPQTSNPFAGPAQPINVHLTGSKDDLVFKTLLSIRYPISNITTSEDARNEDWSAFQKILPTEFGLKNAQLVMWDNGLEKEAFKQLIAKGRVSGVKDIKTKEEEKEEEKEEDEEQKEWKNWLQYSNTTAPELAAFIPNIDPVAAIEFILALAPTMGIKTFMSLCSLFNSAAQFFTSKYKQWQIDQQIPKTTGAIEYFALKGANSLLKNRTKSYVEEIKEHIENIIDIKSKFDDFCEANNINLDFTDSVKAFCQILMSTADNNRIKKVNQQLFNFRTQTGDYKTLIEQTPEIAIALPFLPNCVGASALGFVPLGDFVEYTLPDNMNKLKPFLGVPNSWDRLAQKGITPVPMEGSVLARLQSLLKLYYPLNNNAGLFTPNSIYDTLPFLVGKDRIQPVWWFLMRYAILTVYSTEARTPVQSLKYTKDTPNKSSQMVDWRALKAFSYSNDIPPGLQDKEYNLVKNTIVTIALWEEIRNRLVILYSACADAFNESKYRLAIVVDTTNYNTSIEVQKSEIRNGTRQGMVFVLNDPKLDLVGSWLCSGKGSLINYFKELLS